jgi:hypothetical protein
MATKAPASSWRCWKHVKYSYRGESPSFPRNAVLAVRTVSIDDDSRSEAPGSSVIPHNDTGERARLSLATLSSPSERSRSTTTVDRRPPAVQLFRPMTHGTGRGFSRVDVRAAYGPYIYNRTAHYVRWDRSVHRLIFQTYQSGNFRR